MRFISGTSAMRNKYYLILGQIIVATLMLSVRMYFSAGTLVVPPNDFALVAWNPGRQLLHQGVVDMSYPYPLWTLVLMLPFVLWSAKVGAQLWLICNLLQLAVSIATLVHLLELPERFTTIAIMSFLIGSYDHVFTGLWLGQLVFVPLLSLVLSARALRSGSWMTAGALLAISLIKPQVAFLTTGAILGLALSQRQWKVFIGFGTMLCLFIALAAPFAATPRQIFGGGAGEHLAIYLAHTSTLWGLCLTLAPHSLILPIIVSCLLCGWVFYLWVQAIRKGQWMERILYLIVITSIVNLMIIPYSWSYNLAILVFPFCYAANKAWRLNCSARIFWIMVLIALIYPLSRGVYLTLTSVYRSDVYQIIPVLLFLPLMAALQQYSDRRSCT